MAGALALLRANPTAHPACLGCLRSLARFFFPVSALSYPRPTPYVQDLSERAEQVLSPSSPAGETSRRLGMPASDDRARMVSRAYAVRPAVRQSLRPCVRRSSHNRPEEGPRGCRPCLAPSTLRIPAVPCSILAYYISYLLARQAGRLAYS